MCADAQSTTLCLCGCLQAVFDLPAQMKAAIEEDALDSAVSFYAEALPLLRKYGHKGAFRGIAADSEAAAKEVSVALKRRLTERKDDTEQVVLLLRKLGEGDDTLQVQPVLAQQCRGSVQQGTAGCGRIGMHSSWQWLPTSLAGLPKTQAMACMLQSAGCQAACAVCSIKLTSPGFTCCGQHTWRCDST